MLLEGRYKNLSESSPTQVVTYCGLVVFLLSFFLPAVGSFSGFWSALWALTFWDTGQKYSWLALFGGLLNPVALTLFFLSIFRVAPRLRAFLTLAILFSIPMTWIAIQRMNAAGMALDLQLGHFVWIAGILLIVFPNIKAAFSYAEIRWLGLGSALIIAFLCVPLLIALTMHPASGMDDFYYVVAWNLEEPVVCGKINADAIGRPDQRDSTDLTYMRSDCYRNVAAATRAPRLCTYVKSASADRLIGSPLARSSCRKQKYTLGSAMPGSGPNFIGGMRSIVSSEELSEFLYEIRPFDYFEPILNTLREDDSFLSRLNASASYEEPIQEGNKRDAHPLEFLDEIVGIDWDLPALCHKISRLAQAKNFSGGTGSLRFACFTAIAFNHRDSSICQELPEDHHQSCLKNITILQTSPGLKSFRYGPDHFPQWPQFQEAMEQLGYSRTAAWLQLPNPTSEQYEQYFWRLLYPRNPMIRADFVQRVLAAQ